MTKTIYQPFIGGAFPFDFSITNSFKGQDGPSVLYIVNDTQAESTEKEILLRIISKERMPKYTFKGIGTSGEVTNDTYNLALVFRKGTLHTNTINDFNTILESAFITAFNEASIENTVVIKKAKNSRDGEMVWYIAFENDLETIPENWALNLNLKGVYAEAGTGSRSTQIAIKVANLFLDSEMEHKFAFSSALHVDIINHLGSTYAPMNFGVVGKNVLLNQSGNIQELIIYFESIGRIPLKFTKNTTIEFAFPYDNIPNPNDFGTASEIEGYHLNTDDTDFGVSHDNQNYTSQTSSQKAGKKIFKAHICQKKEYYKKQFTFSQIQISGQDGIATIEITMRNLPAYWDTTFFVPIHKETSVLKNGILKLGNSRENGKKETGSRIDFLSAEPEKVQILEESGLNLIGAKDRPVRVKNTDLIVEKKSTLEGPVTIKENLSLKSSINNDIWLNTNNEDNQLQISSSKTKAGLSIRHIKSQNDWKINTAIDGSLTVYPTSTDNNNTQSLDTPIKFYGRSFELSRSGIDIEKGEKDADLKVIGRIKDKTGELMPVGSIIAYRGANAPEGWLLCDGADLKDKKFSDSKFNDLKKISGEWIPDLRSRFIVGANPEDDNYELTKSGGEDKHTLTIEEMPKHNHYGFGEHSKDWPLGTTGVNKIGSSGGVDWDNQYYNTSYTGDSMPHNNLPPYYALTYIIKY